MSTQQMSRMLDKAMNDETFAKGLIEAVGAKAGDDAVAAVVAYGTGNGYQVTAEDAVAMQRQLLAAGDGADGDLDDSDLENVSGGIGLGNLAAMMGGGGALGSVLGGGGLAGGLVGGFNQGVKTVLTGGTAVDAGAGVAAAAAGAVGDFVKQW